MIMNKMQIVDFSGINDASRCVVVDTDPNSSGHGRTPAGACVASAARSAVESGPFHRHGAGIFSCGETLPSLKWLGELDEKSSDELLRSTTG
jgi:hypothetical protein